MNTYTVFWLDGQSQVVDESSTIRDLFNHVIDFWESGDQTGNYKWNAENRTWIAKEVTPMPFQI